MTNRRNGAVHVCGCEECQLHPHSALSREHRAVNRVMAGLNEKCRRRFAGVLAIQQGRGGMQRVMEITGLSRNTIRRGRSEVARGERVKERGCVRRAGGGRQTGEKSILAS